MRTRSAVVVAACAAIVAGVVPAEAQVTCLWTDNPLVAGETPIKAAHINEIRACIDRILAGGTLPPAARVFFTVDDVVIGTGEAALPGDIVRIRYVAWLWNEDGPDRKGQQVDSGKFEFVLGVTQTLRAFKEGLGNMRVGGLRRMQVPPEFALGGEGQVNIPPNSTLVIEVELLEVRDDVSRDQCGTTWQVAGRGEAVVDVPACVDWVRVFVGPVEPFVQGNRQISDITIYMRSTRDFDAWRRIAYGRLGAGACASYGQSCTVEASVGIGNAVQLAVSQEDAPIQIEWTFTGIDEPQLPE